MTCIITSLARSAIDTITSNDSTNRCREPRKHWIGSTWVPYEEVANCPNVLSVSRAVPYSAGYGSYQTEDAIREKLQSSETLPFAGGETRGKSGAVQLSNHIRDLQQQLREILGTKVDIRLKGKESGQLIVHFASNDEFERVVGFLRRAS